MTIDRQLACVLVTSAIPAKAEPASEPDIVGFGSGFVTLRQRLPAPPWSRCDGSR